MDRVARGDDPLVRERHPDHAGRHARAGLPRRRSSRRCAPSSTHANLEPKGVTLTAEDIREGIVGDPVDLHAGAAVPGADQGAARQPRGAGAGRRRRAAGARDASCSRTGRAGAQIVERIALAAQGARGVARGGPGGVAQDGGLAPPEPARQAGRLLVDRSRQERAVHRRGRLGRRLRQAGPRAQDAGDPSAARQGAEHRAGVAAEGAVEQGAAGPGVGARLRRRRGLQDRDACATTRSSC